MRLTCGSIARPVYSLHCPPASACRCFLDAAGPAGIRPQPGRPPALMAVPPDTGASAPRARRVADAGDAPVPGREAPVPRRHRVLPDGRLLRDVLRGRAGGVARPRADADVALEGRVGRRHPDVRHSLSRARHLPAAPRPQGLSRRDLRAGRGSRARRRASSGARSCACSLQARCSTPATSTRASRRSCSSTRAGARTAIGRRAARPVHRRVHRRGVRRRGSVAGAERRACRAAPARDRRRRPTRRSPTTCRQIARARRCR